MLIVECPVCKEKVKLREKPKHYFRHCGIAHDIEKVNVINGYTRQKSVVTPEIVPPKNTKILTLKVV